MPLVIVYEESIGRMPQRAKRLEHFEAEVSALGNALRGKALAPGYVPCILQAC